MNKRPLFNNPDVLLKILKAGKPDLSESILIGIDLREFDLSGGDLRGAVLIGCRLPTDPNLTKGLRLGYATFISTNTDLLFAKGRVDDDSGFNVAIGHEDSGWKPGA